MVKLKCTFAVIFLLSVCEFQSVFADKVTSALIGAVLRNYHKNEIFSPILVTEGLWQLYIGAKDESAEEISKVLQLGIKIGKYKSQYIEDYATWRQNLSLPTTEFNWANKLFVANNINILPKYRQQTKDIFQNEHQNVNFENSTVTSKLINDWSAKETKNKITNVIQETKVDTRLMFLSAIYFKGFWKNAFQDTLTHKEPFYIPLIYAETRKVEVEMMQQKGFFRLNTIDKLDAKSLELPYKNSSLSMVILLPNTVHGIDKITANFNQMDINDIAPKSKRRKLEVILPKFKFEGTFDLNWALNSLGFVELFKYLDLSWMIDFKKSIYVDGFFQKAVIAVDEEGSTASVVQGIRPQTYKISVPRRSKRSSSRVFRANHPFVFLIKDDNVVYLAGCVAMK